MPVVCLPGTIDALRLHALNPRRYPYLLQTLGGSGWDITFAFPQQTILYSLADLARPGPSFFSLLDSAWHSASSSENAADLPFRGGWFVYLGYELLHQLEPKVTCPAHDAEFPVGCLTRIPAAVMVDHKAQLTYLFAEEAFSACLDLLRADIAAAPRFDPQPVGVRHLDEEDEMLFLDGVGRIKEYIRAGDVFQVNLSRRWQAELDDATTAPELYANLRSVNPAPFSGLADFGSCQIISSSPERLVKVTDQLVETRPIAGTYPRSADPVEDERLRQALLVHPKERAEHVMLVDLERNDLGRICQPGSMRVDELMAVQTYAHVHHIESSVQGRLRAGISPGTVLGALFPGGTITGCPKVRTMQIISELEATPRLAYTGSMGYLNHDGSMDFNILIRSFMLQGNLLSFRAGAGIVADSVPERELQETRTKAKGLLRALGASQG